jgi:diguanylate cyclase (GGDEF)-like protein/PAS domain S-box-containing protein
LNDPSPRTKYEVALGRFESAALRATDIEPLQRHALADLRRVIEADVAALYELDGPEGAAALRLCDGLGLEDVAVSSADPQILRALAAEGTISRTYAAGDAAAGLGTTRLTAALRGRRGAFAVLVAGTHAPNGFSAADRGFMTDVANVLALAQQRASHMASMSGVVERYRQQFDENPNPMFITDASTSLYLDANQAAVEQYGYSREQLLTMSPYDLRAPESRHEIPALREVVARQGRVRFDTVHMTAAGERINVHVTVVAMDRNGRDVRVVTVQNLTELHEALQLLRQSESKLEHHAHFDRLTDLPNRALLSERLEAAIAKAAREGSQAAVLFIDVDQFKTINDTMGHSVGDLMLSAIADRLRKSTRPTDCVARMGGDEFIAVLSDVEDEAQVAQVARLLGQVVAAPIRLHDLDAEASISIGIAMFPAHGTDAETLIRNSDTAMYEAKRAGRATARFFRSEMHDAATDRMQLGSDLREAVRTSAFSLAYQPIFSRDGTLQASEALIRWPQHGGPDVGPGAFIPFAEEFGLIVPIGTWVLRTACAQNAAWHRLGMGLRVCVNISGKQLCEPDFAQVVRSALHDSGLPPELLELEMTETVMSLDLTRTVAVLGELRAIGVRIAIDDFGTGYNSLKVLRSLPVDTLKLDMCFVTEIATSAVDRAIAVGIIATAHSIGSRVVAEGIETAEQRAVLNAIGCDEGQGFLFAPGLSVEQFSERYGALAIAAQRAAARAA